MFTFSKPVGAFNLVTIHSQTKEAEDVVDELMREFEDIADANRTVVPGEFITEDPQFMKGHGTYTHENTKVYSSLSGVVTRTNRLISVKPLSSRYTPQIGDLVVGRILDVGQKRWRVDIASKQDAVLLLSSITLPGVLRRKQASDELSMRQFFKEGDLLMAEVQALYADGAVSLHTRSVKFGKLRNGQLLVVPAMWIERSSKHLWECGLIDICVGVNGFIWIMKHIKSVSTSAQNINNLSKLEDAATVALYSSENVDIDSRTRIEISKAACILKAFVDCHVPLNETFFKAALQEDVELARFVEPEYQQTFILGVMAQIKFDRQEQ